ncbi:MAG: tRNA (adenosine(37)-N6)-threonylcarbamoyltransferase complex ATPase subunit type 1 TsaE [candidate division WOR-3 bacterium]
MPITSSALETMLLAENLVRDIFKPTCVALFGELGSGKTVFVKGLAKGLGIKEEIRSPTFVLMCSYYGRMKLNHIDLYRIEREEEFFPLEEVLSEGITAIEWAEKVKEILPPKRIEVKFKILSQNKREIIIDDYRD